MFFRESKQLAAAHHDLRDVFCGLDQKLCDLDKDAVILADYYATLLGHNLGRVESALDLLAGAGVLSALEMMACEHCGTWNKIHEPEEPAHRDCSQCAERLGADNQVRRLYKFTDKSARRLSAARTRAGARNPATAGTTASSVTESAVPVVTAAMSAAVPTLSPAPTPTSDATPSRASLRRLLGAVLRSDADLDAFCLDHFEQTHARFSNGMDRVQKMNILLEREDRSSIFARLREHDPAAVAQHENLLR